MAMTRGTSTWHADEALLTAYVDGALDAVTGASVEQHLTHCADCRTQLRPFVDTSVLDLAWTGIRDTVESPPQPFVVRLARRCGLDEPTSVLLAATTTLRTAWLTGAVVALAFATAAAAWAGSNGIAPFLLVAPMVPVLGVAAAYGPHDDPLETLLATAPYGRTRLILARTLAVLATALPFTFALSLTLPGPGWLAAAWLGPALALVPVTMALSSFVSPRTGSAVVALGWSGVVVLSTRAMPATWPVEATQQLAYLALAVVAVAVLVVRARLDRQIGAVL
jgi:hypothetical protein